jgi:hypothetical protein
MPGPLVLDLIAAVVESGAPPHSALQAVGAALDQVDDPRGAHLLRAGARLGDPRLSDSWSGDSWSGDLRARDLQSRGAQSRAVRPRDPRLGDLWRAQAGPGRGQVLVAMEEALSLAARSGLPPTALVRRAAAEERRRQLSAQLRAIRRLEVLLVIPAGLCLLPAFVLLGIVPLVIDLIHG